MNIKNVFAGVMTADIEKAANWYEHLFNRKSDYHPMPNVYEWDFEKGGVLQLVLDKKLAGRSSITLLVDDMDKIKENLFAKNINIESESASDIATTVTIFDPENNRITFAKNNQGR